MEFQLQEKNKLVKKSYFLLLIILLPQLIYAQREEEIRAYIEQYKSIAIEEMVKFGIPASVTIAQGIHESTAGKSKLALHSNNHFGIKCHKDWNGNGYHHDDDAPQECFRVYENPEESYRDHSQFLLSRGWYKPLFSLSKTDYNGWAYGLKKAGYATNPKYPEIIIGLIERYKLFELDTMYRFSNTPTVPCGTQCIINGTRAVIYNDSLPIENLCACCGISTSNLYLFNDADVRHSFKKGDVLFIEPKRTKGNSCSYTVTETITYRLLSQKLGIQLAALLRYNGDKEDRLLVKDETIALCETSAPVNKIAYHIVKKGESLYTIAKEQNMTILEIKDLNGLTTEKLAIGQKIKLKK